MKNHYSHILVVEFILLTYLYSHAVLVGSYCCCDFVDTAAMTCSEATIS